MDERHHNVADHAYSPFHGLGGVACFLFDLLVPNNSRGIITSNLNSIACSTAE
ncbi:hypothetical protein RND71_014863 [Anisodus tanguticus]|uniref:Uncharacterized protein n=1 Tax=Anisodus tanguticus TaxID=243964 RepID=A0AAE1VEG9_9SOLA|nr:hypothetical protein RND71_014863 [Anisodus tanguticus]